MTAQDIFAKLWNLCNVLRDDGVTYHQYVTELTYLLFLKMDDERARELGLPQRMLRYQFGPFFAYFHSGRIDDLLALTEYALQRTPNAEEAHLWHGWAMYRLGKKAEAIADFRKALDENPNYQDAQYALNFVQQNP